MSEDTRSRRPVRGPFGGGPGMGPTEKPKEFRKTWMSLIRYSRSHMPMVIVALVMAVLGAVLEVVGPDKLKELTDEIIKGVLELNGGVPGVIDIDVVAALGLFLIGLYVGVAALKTVLNWTMATVTQKISRQMRSDISHKINRLPFSYFNKASYGDVLSRVTNDVDAIGVTLNQSIPALVTAVAMLIGSLIMMLITNWTMALTAVGSSILGFALMAIVVTKSQKFFVAQQNELGDMNGHVEEAYTGHTVIKAYNSGPEFKKAFEEINSRLYSSGWKSQFFTGMMWPMMSFIGNFGYVAVCVVGAVLTMDGAISYGVIVAFMLYVRLFTQPLSQLAQAASSLQRTAAASERVFEFLNEKELEGEAQKVKRITDAKGDVEFRNVRFGYTPDKTVIRDFSAKVKAGERIAIVGPTGAGKTTLVNLLMRFYEIDGGQILIDGVPTNEVAREDVHDQFCMVLQDTWLFEGTIKENIIYSKQNVSDEEVVAACKAVGLHHFIHTLPDGYDTALDDNTALSEGQKQLLTIARAIIKGSPLLILDEATSSVDTRTERIVQEAMDTLTRGRTSFIIAHRLSTIKNADKILVIRDGDIVESGTHSELLAKNGFYAELYNSQFETAA